MAYKYEASDGRWILSETGKCLMTWWNVAKCHGANIRTSLPTWRHDEVAARGA